MKKQTKQKKQAFIIRPLPFRHITVSFFETIKLLPLSKRICLTITQVS